jgi:FkbM family methyltransferase
VHKQPTLHFENAIFMQKIINTIRSRYYKWTERKINLPIDTSVETERLGTGYGGWIVPKGIIDQNSICYLVGAGEDLSFDVALAERYQCATHIFDPTPRSVEHFKALKLAIETGQSMPLANTETGFYPAIAKETAQFLHFHNFGIWNEDTTLRFYAPANDAYVSHSIVNLQKTDKFIEVPVQRLSSVMRRLVHTQIDLIKIDIEGAEYQVIEAILTEKIKVKALCIEFDESAANHFDGKYLDRIENALKSLIAAGFTLIAKEPNCHNYTLLRKA